VTPEIRAAIDLHLRQGKYPRPNTLSEYLIGKGIACSPQEALAYMTEYKQKGMLNGNPELIELLRTKKTTPVDLAEKPVSESKQIPMAFDPKPFAGIPGTQRVTKPVTKSVPNGAESIRGKNIGTAFKDEQAFDEVQERPPIPQRTRGTPPSHKKLDVRKALDFMLDGGALIIALVVDIVMNVIGWGIIAYDAWTRIAFIAMGIVIVLFALRAWVKGGVFGKVLWLGFALIATFLDISVSVASSHQQSLVAVYDASKDDTLNKLKEQANADQKYLESIRAKQVEKGEGYKSQVDGAVAQSNRSREAVVSYKPELQVSSGNGLNSSAIFTAIPDAWNSADTARLIGLTLYSLCFSLLQIVIVTSATNSVNKLSIRKESDS
jgi:hypothetical protein